MNLYDKQLVEFSFLCWKRIFPSNTFRREECTVIVTKPCRQQCNEAISPTVLPIVYLQPSVAAEFV